MTHKDAPLELWAQKQDPDEDIAYAAFEAITIHYQYLVEGTARKLERRLPDYLEDDELISLGQIGLLKAIERYEPGKGPFSRYASALVYGAIIDGLRQADFAPRGLRKQQRDIDQVIRDLQEVGVLNPTAEQIAVASNMEADEVREIQHRIVRADVAPADPSLLPSNRMGSASENLLSRELCREFVVWLKEFDEDTQKVIVLKYWKGLTMRDIAEQLQIPIEQVRSSHQAVISQVLPFMMEIARDD